MESKKIHLQDASEYAYLSIKEMISRDQLVPNQKITYEQLAKKLELSKTPIVSALNRLKQEEFVISIPNRGFFIKEVSIDELNELFVVRRALEILSIEESPQNGTPDMLREVEKAMMAHRKYDFSTPTRNRLALDAAFHLKIAEMTQNKSLIRLLRHVFEHIYLRHRTEGIFPERFKFAVKEHQNIFESIKKKDLAQAIENVKLHIEAQRVSTIKAIQLGSLSYNF